MKHVAAVLTGLLTLLQSVQGQQENEPRPEPVQQFLFYEGINLVSTDSTQARVDLNYRVDVEFFIPVRNTDPSFHASFKRRGEVLIELFDSLEVSKARDIIPFEIAAETSEQKLPTKQWYQGIASFTVPPGPYKIIFELDDLESERKYLNKDLSIRAVRIGARDSKTSSPLFIYWSGQPASDTIMSQNFGGNLLFGRKGALFFQLASSNDVDKPLRVEYTFSTRQSRFQDPEIILSDTAHYVMLKNMSPVPIGGPDSIGYVLTPVVSEKSVSIIVPLLTEKLPLRPLDLIVKVRRDTAEIKLTKSLQMVWPEMPLSLRDVDFAIDALRYITREEQRDSIKRGSLEDRRKKLEEFWKAKDKTPETAYNEVMTEYYRRVDYAVKNFGTLREVDGSKSDRGRIYILHGPPTKIDRTLDPSGFQEVWSYENLGKKFIFIDKTKSGKYELVATQNL
jgi:GWxTD domain-containing protein